jgi:hypothetical protein
MELKRIYFISRDGEILLEIARKLLPAFWPGSTMELKYLLGSRQAWLLPSFIASKRDIHHFVLDFFQNSSLKIIFARVALTLSDCEEILPQYGFSVGDWERKFVPDEAERVEALLMDAEIQRRITERADEFKDHALGYLEHEGLFEEISYGLVDLGWTGVSKGALEGILSLRGKAPPPFFFFGRLSRSCQDDQSILYTYSFNMDKAMGVKRKLPGIPVVLEIFCASLAGGLLQYERRGSRYEPVFRQSSTEAIRAWGFETMRQSILTFTEKLAIQAPRMKAPFYLPPSVSDALLRAFWMRPTRAEALKWGQFPFEEDPGGSSHNRLVPRVRLVNFWRVFWHGRGFHEYSEWRRGLMAANPPWVGLLWLACLSGYRIRIILERAVGLKKK